MITKEYLQQELAKRIKGYKPSVETTTDNIIAEMKSILVLVDALPDYEKKYNEALERAKKFAIDDAYASQGVIAKLIFPELRESEDERIIEEIKFAVMQMPSERKDTKNRCLAWLEKQKESHIPWYDYQKSKEAGYTIIPNEEYEQLIKQKEQKPQVFCEAKAYDLGYKQGKEDAIKEQKPAWSKEDERILKGIIGKIDHDQTYGVSKDEMLNFLKKL